MRRNSPRAPSASSAWRRPSPRSSFLPPSSSPCCPPTAAEPSAVIYLAYVGGAILAAGVVALGVGLLRGARDA